MYLIVVWQLGRGQDLGVGVHLLQAEEMKAGDMVWEKCMSRVQEPVLMTDRLEVLDLVLGE